MISLLFAIPGLDWSSPSDHVELFCGQGEVTTAEIQDWCMGLPFFSGTEKFNPPIDITRIEFSHVLANMQIRWLVYFYCLPREMVTRP